MTGFLDTTDSYISAVLFLYTTDLTVGGIQNLVLVCETLPLTEQFR